MMMNSDRQRMDANAPGVSGLTLVLMAGLPGSGKTTLALALGKAQGWPVIDKDSIKSPLLTLGVSNEIAGPASYVLLLQMAQDLLVQQRLSVILDSPAAYLSVLERVQSMTGLVGARLKIIRCVASRDLRVRRIFTRIARPSQWNIGIGIEDDQERQMFAHLPSDVLVLDTGRPFAQCLSIARNYLYQQ